MELFGIEVDQGSNESYDHTDLETETETERKLKRMHSDHLELNYLIDKPTSPAGLSHGESDLSEDRSGSSSSENDYQPNLAAVPEDSDWISDTENETDAEARSRPVSAKPTIGSVPEHEII